MLLLPLALILSAHAAPPPASSPALSSLLAAEYAFADQVEKQGIRSGFMANLRPDSLVFIPRPVNGITYYKTQLELGAFLQWYPSNAGVSQSNDLGYCTGPYVFKTSKDAVNGANGFFLTLWQREGSGPWKVRLDIGTPAPPPGERVAPVALPRPAGEALTPVVAGQPGNNAELLELDRTFAKEAAKNPMIAYKARVDDGIILLRKGRFPVEGVKSLAAALDPGEVTWTPSEAMLSVAGDMGFTRGTLTHQDASGKTDCNYVRVWKKQGSAWKLVVDLELALAKK